ncbi:DUF952 domain-containing protein [Pontivivens insulae]|uniref:DUF952 domain-containing protein n=1 Tax=Pontivivens insulae TaxID=1639689 RepID=A0A2R8ADU6_9RHOB|nr:DUF952 domain-containing protein [Pontivivens insulae]RED14312.1 uncharacterized protein (DUF952 family) [Pontivivens insulae]SPF30389.1 hypothetical protein POI8812_02725 [Pontivivens insulae]
MLIYKIFRAEEWEQLVAEGQTLGAPIDLTDGYIHFSTAETVRETASKYFAGIDGLVLVLVEADGLGQDLRWEVSRGGVEFPHLYRALRMSDVADHMPLPLDGEGHSFPEEVA